MRICLEQSAFPGVIRVTEKVAHDVELVSGKKPQILVEKEIPETLESSGEDWTIIAATKGKSSFLKKLEEAGSAELKELEQKRECYAWIFPEIKNRTKSNLLVIAGSDKRGTIYGLFHLSEMLGVSPFVDWCGLMPPKQEKIELREDMACISKEPSVRYRGFFINDEWPAFGNWCNHNFGGFNAKAYDHVFELLLRLKGNYLWPAMWSARFADDGPGLLNAELADEYGIIMGMSHHEPCLRQGEEYKYLRGKNSVYGDAWNFRTNREGITKFWEDGLKRSGKFENVITVGMRGEADTAIMGKNATLEDNADRPCGLPCAAGAESALRRPSWRPRCPPCETAQSFLRCRGPGRSCRPPPCRTFETGRSESAAGWARRRSPRSGGSRPPPPRSTPCGCSWPHSAGRFPPDCQRRSGAQPHSPTP